MPLIWNNQAALDARYQNRPLVAGGNAGGTFGPLNNKLYTSTGSVPTVATGPNNTGSGAAAARWNQCSDIVGAVRLTTGSTATAGSLATITFGTPGTFGALYLIFLQMLDHPDADPYPLNTLQNSFDIGLNTIATGTPYTIQYFVVETF